MLLSLVLGSGRGERPCLWGVSGTSAILTLRSEYLRMPDGMKTKQELNKRRLLRTMIAGSVAVLGFVGVVEGADDIFAVRLRGASGLGQVLERINDNSTIASSSIVYSLFGIYGATFKDGTYYVIELENGTFVDYLATIPHEGGTTGFGARVGVTPIGFPNVEALANVNGTLVAASVDFGGHKTQLISISTAGVGALIGNGPTDVLIVGLAYDPVGGVLYGASIPFATVSGYNLWTINPSTGAMNLVGSLGTEIQSLSWSMTHGLIGAFDHLYSISTTTGAATQIGTTDYTNDLPGTINGVWALGAIPPVAAPGEFEITSVTRDGAGEVTLVWNSATGFNYVVEFRGSLAAGSWGGVSGTLTGTAGTMIHMHTPGVPDGYYRVSRVAAP